MKTKQNLNTKADLLLLSKSDKTVLKHILSPLELCAWDNEYKPFTYKLDNIPIKVSATDCMKFLATSKTKIDTFSLLIFKTSNQLTGGNSKAVNQFLDSDITTHQLPNYILNVLCYRYKCKTTYDVLRLGKKEISTSKGIGKTAIKYLETLFKKHKCKHFF
jgi:hypothetical protein